MTAHYLQEGRGASTYLGLLRTAGLMLYLSPSWGAVGGFFTGTGAGLSTSKPEDTMFIVDLKMC